MKLKEDSSTSQVSKLKEEIGKLQKELDNLQAEHYRLSGESSGETNNIKEIVNLLKTLSDGKDIYQRIVEEANEGILISDLKLKIIFVNKRMTEMMGYTEEEMIGSLAYEYLDEEEKEIAKKNLTERFGEKAHCEQKYIRKNGSALWASLSESPLHNEEGNIIGFLCLLTDISERKVMEDALKKSEQRYRQVVESANSIIMRMDIKGTIKYINEFAARFFEYSPEELLNRNVTKLIPEKDTDGWRLSGLIERIVSDPDKYLQFENENVTKSGKQVWVNWANRVLKDENGNVFEVLSIGNDITERKKIEDEARLRTTEIEAILSCIADGVIVYDKLGRIINMNSAAREILNIREEEKQLSLKERFLKHYKVWTEDERSLTHEEIPAYRSSVNGETINNALLRYEIDGVTKWINISAAPLIVNNIHIGGVVSMADMTWRKQAEEKIRSNEAILEAFYDASPGILILFDQQLNFLKSDSVTPTYFNLDRQSIIGKSLYDLNPNVAEHWIKPIMENVIATGIPQLNIVIDSPLESRNGESAFWTVSLFSVPLPGGQTGIGVVGMEITEIKTMEDKRAKERELFEGIISNIPVMITIYDPKVKHFSFNKYLTNLLGWTEEETADGSLMEKMLPDPAYRQQAFEYMESLEPGWKEWILTTKDGCHVASSWANILLPSGLQIGIGIDITERKRAEAALMENEQRLRGTFNNAAIGIVEVDRKGKFIAVNDRMCQMLGYSQSELIGNSILDITYQEDWQLSREVNSKLFTGEEQMTTYEKRYVKKDGTILWVHVTVSGVFDYRGKHLYSIGTIEDISDRKKVESELRYSEERFRLLADNIHQMVWIYDREGQPVWFNKRWLDFTGMGIEEMKLDGHLKVNHPDNSSSFAEFQRCIREGIPWEDTYRMRNKNGEYRWFLSRAVPIKDENGNVKLWFGTSTDITEQRWNEERLRSSEQRLEAIFNNAAIGIFETDNAMRFIMVNAKMCEILGYSREELLGKSAFEITSSQDKEHTSELYEKLSSGQEKMLIQEKRYVRKNGSLIWAHVSGSAIEDQKGKLTRIIGTFMDISERKKAEDDLKESEEKFRSLFENIVEGVALYELTYKNTKPVNFRLLEVNPAFKEYIASESKTAEGVTATEIFNSSQLQYLNEFSKVSETRQPYKYETFIPSVSKHFIINVISPKKGQFAVVLEDITEQKRILHELNLKNEELTRFIYTVSHDLKSPLVTIKLFTSYLREDIDKNDAQAQSRDMGYIENAADKMGKLLDELLELSRIGRKDEFKQFTPMREIAQAAIDLVAGRLSKKNIKVKFTGPQVMLYGQQQRLIQLYQNLLDNASKFTGNQAEPEITIGSQVEDTKEIVLFVRDNGVGIEPKYRDKVFGLFEKLDNKTEGTGIGLALIKRIVDVYGGRIWFTSKGKNKGTTFYFTLEKTYLA